jgi:hypothetical protein
MPEQVSPTAELKAVKPYCLRVAIILWLASLCLPTLRTESKTTYGFEVALQFVNPMVWLFAPLIFVLASLTNLLFIQQVARLSRAGQSGSKEPSPTPIAVALLINIIACGSLVGTPTYQVFFPNLLTSPGVWLWLCSFVLLLIGIMREEYPHQKWTPASHEHNRS